MKVKIRAKLFRLVFRAFPKLCDAMGYCGDKKIEVDERLEGKKRLTVIVHELLHACFPDINEEAITCAARDISRVLYRLGYRGE